MKTPEEIKLGLERCRLEDSCENGCPYHHEGCGDEMRKDALAYIRQLETVLDEALLFMKDKIPDCTGCKYIPLYAGEEPCASCRRGWFNKTDDNWKWCGEQPKEEETC